MNQREISLGTVVGIGVAVAALFLGLFWWRTSVREADSPRADALTAQEGSQQFQEQMHLSSQQNKEVSRAEYERQLKDHDLAR